MNPIYNLFSKGWGDYSVRSRIFRALYGPKEIMSVCKVGWANLYTVFYQNHELSSDMKTFRDKKGNLRSTYFHTQNMFRYAYLNAMYAYKEDFLPMLTNSDASIECEYNEVKAEMDLVIKEQKSNDQLMVFYGFFPARFAYNDILVQYCRLKSIYDRPSGKVDNMNTILWRDLSFLEKISKCDLKEKLTCFKQHMEAQIHNISQQHSREDIALLNKYSVALWNHENFAEFRKNLFSEGINIDTLTIESCTNYITTFAQDPENTIFFISDYLATEIESAWTGKPETVSVTLWELWAALHQTKGIVYLNAGMRQTAAPFYLKDTLSEVLNNVDKNRANRLAKK